MALAIKAENISKAYQLGEFSTGTISRDIERWWHKLRGKEDPFLKIGEINDRTAKGSSNIVWSLKDINFEVAQGDAVGIIGRNGAGKSTLLKILSRVTTPTTGGVKVKGRIASLLEVGTGFHPELTGRENIYLNGAILGMRKAEIKRKFDEIVDFAGVERYIDTPVKRYSSGMYVRLAFAVAAHLESEILIVDEVLAVGDAEFQKKCLGKMNDVSRGEGRTVLFVSHNMGSIQSLCNKGVLLENGIVKVEGSLSEAIRQYLVMTRDTAINTFWEADDNVSFDENFAIKKAALVNKQGDTYNRAIDKAVEGLFLTIEGNITHLHPELKIGYELFDQNENLLFTSLTTDDVEVNWPVLALGMNLIITKVPIGLLKEGKYKVNISISIHGKKWICNAETQSLVLGFELIDNSPKSPYFDQRRDVITVPPKFQNKL